MFRINIILMLSTIIPDLDCCSSFTILHRKSIHLYPADGIELSLHTSVQFQQNHFLHNGHHQTSPSSPPAAPPPPQLLPPAGRGGEAQTSFWYKYLHLHFENSNTSEEKSEEEDDDDDEYLKLNRSQRVDAQNQEERLEQSLMEDNFSRLDFLLDASKQHDHILNASAIITDATVTTTTTTKITTTTQGEEFAEKEEKVDAHFKLISEIVSLECIDVLRLEFCLNGGRCFLYPILNHSLSSCECAEGFVGERCEAKSYEFIPRIRPRLVLAKTIGGPLIYGLAFIDILFLLFLFCKNFNRD